MADQPTKYCDLVMKGGITSGIVYPNAVLELAKEFRFKNIGGTSAGAIAAAACAAAAMGDRWKHAGLAQQSDPKVGFEGLRTVAKQLSTQGFIFNLFQPAPGAKNAYRFIVVQTGAAGPLRKTIAPFLAVIAIAPFETLLVLAVLLGLGFWAGGWKGVLAAALPTLACAWAAGAWFSLQRVARVARRNLLGLCTGLPPKSGRRSSKPAMTEWLHAILQELSGKPADQPLTFADLWAAPRYDNEPGTAQAISLQMITTGVSHHEPRSIPFEKSRFWFRRSEFDLLFPKALVDWMVEKAGSPITIDGVDYFSLPADGDLPVVVGMRMSLSFPLLISAVPLHEPARWDKPAAEPEDAETAENTVLASVDGLADSGQRRPPAGSRITAFRVCWFSDGGISSNFPIHLFDAPLPQWPTFAIDLVYADTDDDKKPDDVFLPDNNKQGWQRIYQPIADPSAVKELSGFLFGIVATMQNWRDLLQSRAPGQRDRIVHVSLTDKEGGMNLNMPQNVLDAISGKGTRAGQVLQGFSFENHYWIRWRNLASALQRYTIRAADVAQPEIPAYAGAFQTARTGSPPPPSYRFGSKDRQKEAERLLDHLTTQAGEWKDGGSDLDLTEGAPRPLPQLHIIATY